MLTTINPESRQLVVNWHMTEACNYSCSYCYAHWNKTTQERDLMRDFSLTKSLLDELFSYFSDNPANPLRAEMRWDSVRLNLAGGEPLLNPRRTLEVVSMAKQIGFEVSMITNGSRLDAPTLDTLAPNLTLLGISLDSLTDITNQKIGRMDRQGLLLSQSNLLSALTAARAANPGFRLKINTVVNTLNCQEDMSTLIQNLAPDKWKVLRMLPVVTNQLEVTDKQFNDFVARHSGLAAIMSTEDNDSLTESYIMVDPKGRFFQNSTGPGGGGYHYSRSILESGAGNAFADLTFSARKFLARYSLQSARSPLLNLE